MKKVIVSEASETPWLSVVIPIYNAERYLDACLASITGQSFCDFEVILIDDGSTDHSSDICRKICKTDSRYKYYRTKNRGTLRTRLYGMEKIRGKYFTFCDADDYYANFKVFEKLHAVIGNIKELFSFIQFGYYGKFNHLSSRKKYVKQDMYIDEERFYAEEYPLLLCSRWEDSHLSLNVWNKVYDSSLVENICLLNESERVFFGEDQIINLLLLQKIKGAYYLSDLLYVYRQLTGGTSKFSLTTMEDLNRIKAYQLHFLNQKGHPESDRIRKYLFAEMAAWSALYIRKAANYLDDDQLEKHIDDMLKLPTFVQARNYYSEYPEAWDEAELIRKAQVQDYLEFARRKEKVEWKSLLNKYAKQLYKSI